MKNLRGLIPLFICLSFLTACGSETAQRLWLKAPGWSRAQVVGGMGFPDPAPLVVDKSGNVYFLFIDGEPEGLQARIAAFNQQADLLWEYTFNGILKRPDEPQLVWSGERLQAFWLDSQNLVTAQVDANGHVLKEPVVISGEISVESYSTAGSVTGNVAVWFATSRRDSNLYLADINLVEEPLLIDDEGVLPELRFDKAGTLHALWAHYPLNSPQTAFLYAAYPDGRFTPDVESVVHETGLPLTAIMTGPTLGIDNNNVYVYWVVIHRTGLEAGTIQTKYITFSQDEVELIATPREIIIPLEHDLNYETLPEQSIQAGERYSLASLSFPRTGVLQDIGTNPVQEEELAIAFQAGVNYYWRRIANQIGVVYLKEGVPISYQLLSFTQAPSVDPMIMSDSNGRLYVTWLESGDGSRFDVYFASTTDAFREAFSPVTINDVTGLTATTIFGMLTGVLLSPIVAVLWLILPVFAILLTAIFRRGEQTFLSLGTVITFILSIAAYQVTKVGTLPAITDYVPFSAWLPLPDNLKVPIKIIVPGAILIGAIIGAWHFTYRRKMQSPLYFMFVFAAIDASFTMAVYGVLFYGAF